MSDNPSPDPGIDCRLVFRCEHCGSALETSLRQESFWVDDYHECYGEKPGIIAQIDGNGAIRILTDDYRLDLKTEQATD